MFKLWSELNNKVKKELKPDFGLRNWDELNEQEKDIIWKHLRYIFFDKDLKRNGNPYWWVKEYYNFYWTNEEQEQKKSRVFASIVILNNNYKCQNYAPNCLDYRWLNSACLDFCNIFFQQSGNVVLELLSINAKLVIADWEKQRVYKKEGESKKDYHIRKEKVKWQLFDFFASKLNGVFVDFGLNISLTRLGFVPKQEKIIEETIYKPVLKKFSNKKWKKVNRDLSDALDNYRKKDFSGCITLTVSSIQAFLQILVNNGETKKGEISKLIPKAQNQGLIPNDIFATTIFKNMESFFAQERQSKGNSHPKEEYATEKNARVMLNLAMVFFEYCL